MNTRGSRTALRGVTLLELLVALSIMAMAVGVIYRVLGTSVRSVGVLQDQQKAVLLARSLMAAKDAIPEEGWNESGESAGYSWQVNTQPYNTSLSEPSSQQVRLHAVRIQVRWGNGNETRSLALQTLRPQRRVVTSVAGAVP